MAERIVVGLGNPGPAYAESRHNVGFMVIERLVQRWTLAFAAEHDGLRVARGAVDGISARLVQPLEYMNRAGMTLRKLPGPWQTDDMVVVHDDIDLPVGRLRVRHDGGAGGHRGIVSIIEMFGNGFDRVRIGVGRPTSEQDIADFVLTPLAGETFSRMKEIVEHASDAVECLLKDGLERAMNRYNVRQPDSAEEPNAAARRLSCDDTRH